MDDDDVTELHHHRKDRLIDSEFAIGIPGQTNYYILFAINYNLNDLIGVRE